MYMCGGHLSQPLVRGKSLSINGEIKQSLKGFWGCCQGHCHIPLLNLFAPLCMCVCVFRGTLEN